MAISYSDIPASILVPGSYVEIGSSTARRGIYEMPSRVLLIGQKHAGSPATPGVPFLFSGPATVEAQCGHGSMLHRMAIAVRAANVYSETWAIPLEDDGSGVAATGTLEFTGTTSGAGTLNVYIGGRRVRIAVASGTTAAAVATALAAAINADTSLAVTGSAGSGAVTATARHKGEVGNDIDIRVNYYAGEFMPPGLSVDVTPMSGGSGNPDIGNAISALGGTWYTDVICPYTDSANLALIEAEAAARNGPLVMQDMAIYTALSGTYSQLNTWASTRNSRFLFALGMAAAPSMIEEISSAYGGVCSFHSLADPARPLQTLPLPGILPPSPSDRFIFSERDVLLRNGIGTSLADDGGVVRIERAVSTHTTDEFGIADATWRDLETMKATAWLRYQRRAFIFSNYLSKRVKLAADGTRVSAGQSLVTPSLIRADGIAQFRRWEELGIVQNVDAWKDGYIVELAPDDPSRVNELIPPILVGGLRVTATLINISL